MEKFKAKSKFFLFCAIASLLLCSTGIIEAQTKPKNTVAANISPSPQPTPKTSITTKPTPNQEIQDESRWDIPSITIVVVGCALIVVIVGFTIRWLIKDAEKERKKIQEETANMTPEQKAQYFERKRKEETLQKPPNRLIEYRRTCQVCGKVWHSLPLREKQIESNVKTDAGMMCGGAMQNCGTCGALGGGTAAQASRNLDANQSELQRLKSCPECSSVNYKEEVIEHAK